MVGKNLPRLEDMLMEHKDLMNSREQGLLQTVDSRDSTDLSFYRYLGFRELGFGKRVMADNLLKAAD